MNDYKLWYEKPAANWNEALAIGNGIQGAMIYGHIDNEEVQLNEETFWSGYPADNDNPESLNHLEEMRKLVFEKKYYEAQQLCNKYLVAKGDYKESYGSHQTAGSLIIESNYGMQKKYKRELNIYDGVAKTIFDDCERTYFSSYKYNVTVIKLVGKVDDIKLKYVRENADIIYNDNEIIITGELPLKYAVVVKFFKNDNEMQIYISAATAYKTNDDPLKVCTENVDNAMKANYDTIYNESKMYFNELLDRVKLDLHSDDKYNEIPTDERIKNPEGDLGLVEMYFMFGRYLLIGSSKGKLPANLQGIWNKEYHAPWEADYHININAQMNYWPADVCDLSELNDVFFKYIEFLSEEGKVSAKVNYGCNGWVAHTITNPWGFTSLGNHPSWGSFMCAGAWCCWHLWDHYLFTEDIEFLKKYYPVIKSSAEFFVDFLVKDPNTGYLVTAPSNSPENSFIDPITGKAVAICAGPTMDNTIVYDLFEMTVKSAEILNDDKQFIEKIKSLQSQLPPIRVGKHGQVMEWIEDFDENEPGHRHISNLYGLHPTNIITQSKTPELFEAAKVTLKRRLSSGGGHTGWSRAWIINFYARLFDGNSSYEHIKALFEHSTLPNMFDNHPPFQIDGNFGATAGIAEMLVQSHEDFINILPALPDSWASGEVKGLIARGNYKIDIKWEDKKVISCKIKSLNGNNVKVKMNDEYYMSDSNLFLA